MKTNFIVLLMAGIAISVFFTSCSTSSLTLGTARITEVNGAIVHTPVLVDEEVLPKDSAVSVFNNQTGSTPSLSDVEGAKSSCLYSLLTKTHADEIVAPNFNVETEGSKITVKVIGFPAKYKNFRTATVADSNLIKMYKYVPYNQVVTGQAGANVAPVSSQKNSSGAIAAVLIIIALAAVIIGVAASH